MMMINCQVTMQPDRNRWIRIGLVAAVVSILAVLITQWLAITIWPEIALFKPLDSYLTILASSVAAFMHLVAAVVIVTVLAIAYRQQIA